MNQGLIDKISKGQIGANLESLFGDRGYPVIGDHKPVAQCMIGGLVKGEDGTEYQLTGNGWIPVPTLDEIVKSLPSGDELEGILDEPVDRIQKLVKSAQVTPDRTLLHAISDANEESIVKSSIIAMDMRYPGFFSDLADYLEKGGKRKGVAGFHQEIRDVVRDGKTIKVKKWVSDDKDKVLHGNLESLPKGSHFDDAKRIDGIFTKSKHSYSEAIEAFESNKDKAKVQALSLSDIQITQPNIQSKKVIGMLDHIGDLPVINAVQFGDDKPVIFDGHHRLIANWVSGNKTMSVNLVKIPNVSQSVKDLLKEIDELDPSKPKDRRLFFQMVDELVIDHGYKYEVPDKWKGDKPKKGDVLDLALSESDGDFTAKSEQFFFRHKESVNKVLTSFENETGKDLDVLVGALTSYQYSSYDPVNKYLRAKTVSYDSIKESGNSREDYISNMEAEIACLDYLTTASKLTESVAVYRGIAWNDKEFNLDLSDLKVGGKYEDFGFQSTSLNKEIAEEFSHPSVKKGDSEHSVLLRLTIKEGQSALPVKSVSIEFDEHEVLIPRGQPMRIVKIDDAKSTNGKAIKLINLEYYE